MRLLGVARDALHDSLANSRFNLRFTPERDLRATPQRDDIPVTTCFALTLWPEFRVEHTYAMVNFRMQSMAMVDYHNHVL